MFHANCLDWSWYSECTMQHIEGHPWLVPPVSPLPSTSPRGLEQGLATGQLRLLCVCVPSPPGPWHSLETHHHPQSSQSLGLCKLIVQSHLSGNSLCESSQESGLYLTIGFSFKKPEFFCLSKKADKSSVSDKSSL